MAVTAQTLDYRTSRADGHPAAPLECGEVPVVGAGEGLGYDPRRAGTEAVDLSEGACGRPLGELGVAEGVGDLQCPLERPHLGAGGEFTVEVVNGKSECRRRPHDHRSYRPSARPLSRWRLAATREYAGRASQHSGGWMISSPAAAQTPPAASRDRPMASAPRDRLATRLLSSIHQTAASTSGRDRPSSSSSSDCHGSTRAPVGRRASIQRADRRQNPHCPS